MRTRLETTAWTLLGVELVAVLVFSLAYDSLDFHIYVLGGQVVQSGTALYDEQLAAHWFTYTPFAAELFRPLSWLPLTAMRLVWQLGSVGALAVACAAVRSLAGPAVRRIPLVAIVAGGLLTEPVWHTLFLGQVNLYLLALVLVDLVLLSRGRTGGLGIGVAAAVKLTPAIFIVLLLLAGRTRAAATAAASALGCTALAWLLAPLASEHYWRDIFYDTSRVGVTYISNQSPFGALARLLGSPDRFGTWYLLVPLVLAGAGLALGSSLLRSGDWLAATAVTGTTGLVVSPISWTHHWVWALPALAVLLRDGRRTWAVAGYGLFVVAPMWWTPHHGRPLEYGFHGWLTLVANSYLVAGLAYLVYAAVTFAGLRRGSGWASWVRGARLASGPLPSAEASPTRSSRS